jgi:hypothetical protein
VGVRQVDRQAAAAGHQDHQRQDQLEGSPGHVQLQGDRHGTGLQCALVKPSFSACRSRKTYKHLKPGKYTFEVRAFNAAGADPTPAKKSFTIT